MIREYLWLIPALPALAALLIALLGYRVLRGLSHWPCILGVVGAGVVSVMVLTNISWTNPVIQSPAYNWFSAGEMSVAFSLRADSLTAIMLVTVTFMATFIAIYSAGYMHDDPGYPRFF